MTPGLFQRALRHWRSLSVPAFLAVVAVLTALLVAMAYFGLIPAILGVSIIVPIASAALHYPQRRAYAGGWLISAVQMVWLTNSGRIAFFLSTRDAILLALAGLFLAEVLYRVARERAVASERLASSERFFKAVLENASDMVWVIDADATLRYASQAALALSTGGTSPLGRSGLEFIVPADRARALDRLAESLRRPNALISDVSFSIVNGMNQETTLSIAMRNLLGDPDVRGIVVNGRDITAVVRAEEALRNSERNYRQLYLAAAEQARKLAALDQVRTAVAEVDCQQALASAAARAVSAALSQSPTAIILSDRNSPPQCEIANSSPDLRACLDAPNSLVETARNRGIFAFSADGYGQVAVRRSFRSPWLRQISRPLSASESIWP
jgi:PAS domain S-box-containing protein